MPPRSVPDLVAQLRSRALGHDVAPNRAGLRSSPVLVVDSTPVDDDLGPGDEACSGEEGPGDEPCLGDEVRGDEDPGDEGRNGGRRLRPWLVARPAIAERRFDPVVAWQLSGPAARGLVVVLALALVAAGWLTWRAVPRGEPLPVVAPVVAGPAVSGQPVVAMLVIQIVGPVLHPGIVRVPDGARVIDAIRAAGGIRKGGSAGAVNLARRLVDGEQLVVGPGAVPAGGAGAGPAGSAGSGTGGGPLDLNTATLEQLDALPHVGPVLAQRIIDWRTGHGRFSSVDELREIAGIGTRIFTTLSTLVRV